VAPNEFFWNMEFLVDWTLFYRNREEMLNLAAFCLLARKARSFWNPLADTTSSLCGSTDEVVAVSAGTS